MKMNEPLGDPSYGGFLVRVPLGAYFVLAGLSKFDNFAGFIDEVKHFGILPKSVAQLYGTLLPFLEIGGGTLLVLGAWTTLAAALTSLMLLSFVIAIGAYPHKIEGRLFNKDIILLGASLSLLFTGAGKLSIDRFRKGS